MNRYITDPELIRKWIYEHNSDFFKILNFNEYGVSIDGTIGLTGGGNLIYSSYIPVKFNKVTYGFNIASQKFITSFENFPSEAKWISIRKSGITSLEGISDIVKKMNGNLYVENWRSFKSGGLGVLLIDGIKEIYQLDELNMRSDPFKIINKYIGRDDIYGCQTELIDNGFEEYAKI